MIAIITNVTRLCGCCGEIVEIYLKKHYEGRFRIENDRVIFEDDPPRKVINIVNIELRPKGHQLITGLNAGFIDLIEDALDEMLVSVEKRDVQELTSRDEIKNIQQLVHEKTNKTYDRMERFYKNNMEMSITHKYIIKKIDRTKQLLIEGLDPGEIVIKLNYCNKEYLGSQFKFYTGKTLSQFSREQKK
jgi:hypothetical protein